MALFWVEPPDENNKIVWVAADSGIPHSDRAKLRDIDRIVFENMDSLTIGNDQYALLTAEERERAMLILTRGEGG